MGWVQVQVMKSDEELLAAADSDPLAFAAFYRRHAPRLLAWCARQTGDRETAADLVARTAAAPRQLPVGAIMALLGVPMFLVLLRRLESRA